jgi:hypothetical protein
VGGDWFKGRFYQRRCDLTPDGTHLVYFAASFGAGVPDLNLGYSWTGVSALPSLQPIVAWTKDHCWFGGGLFTDDHRLWVNERPPDRAVTRAARFAVTFNPDARGEDEPLYGLRLTRDGWELSQTPHIRFDGRRFITEVPEIRTKLGRRGEQLVMTRAIDGFTRTDRYDLVTRTGKRFALDMAWVDFDQSGRLVSANDGVLYALRPRFTVVESALIADLNDMRPNTGAA